MKDIRLTPMVLRMGDPSKLRVLDYGNGDFDLLPFAFRKTKPQTRIQLNDAQRKELIVALGGKV